MWGWILILIAAVIVVAAAATWRAMRRRSSRLQTTFGPEYERTVEQSSTRREAESELARREQRRKQLHIRPLSRDAREAFAERWQ